MWNGNQFKKTEKYHHLFQKEQAEDFRNYLNFKKVTNFVDFVLFLI